MGSDLDDTDDEDEDVLNSVVHSSSTGFEGADQGYGRDGRRPNVVLCQFEKVSVVFKIYSFKVSHSKTQKSHETKWKCSFRDGIIHVGGADYMFHRATADFEW